MRRIIIIVFYSLISSSLFSQQNSLLYGGFLRSGAYIGTGDYDDNFTAFFADAAINISATDKTRYNGYADLRIRYGKEFGKSGDLLSIKETWVSCYGKWIEVFAGKKIIKWGRTDFFSPQSRLNPVDFSFRSPDHDDADLGNLLAGITVTPASMIKVSVIAIPFWNPSVMITEPLKLPSNVNLTVPKGLQNGNAISTGIRADFILKSIDFGIQYYHGFERLPGIKLTSTDWGNPMLPALTLEGVPYIQNAAGADFEIAADIFTLRGEVSYSRPITQKEDNEEIPFPQIEWVAGLEYIKGAFTFSFEYYGKKNIEFYKSSVPPIFGIEPDYSALASMIGTPGFDPDEYIRQQIESFNRMYNYQLEPYYHSSGLRIEADLLNGLLRPSLATLYNFTSRDLTIMPVLKYKPADGVTLSAGLDYYHGRKGSMFDIIDGFMNNAFFSLRIDF